MENQQSLCVLVIAAHMDDCELMFGGIIHKLISQKILVQYLIVTDGSAWSAAGVPISANNDSLVQMRKKEQEDAAMQLGVHKIHYLDLKDGFASMSYDIVYKLIIKIREVSPNYIFTHSDIEYHGDHIAVTQWVKALCNNIEEPVKITNPHIFPGIKFIGNFGGLYQNARLEELGTPYIRFFSLDENDIEYKVKALKCFKSQFPDSETLSTRIWNEARYLGQLVGVNFAEAVKFVPRSKYKLIRTLGE
jgi:LmbE family N-acetylglucosaminyl deacetylase